MIYPSGGSMYEKGRLHTIAANESISTRGLEDFRLRTVSRFKVEATLSRPPTHSGARPVRPRSNIGKTRRIDAESSRGAAAQAMAARRHFVGLTIATGKVNHR
jgi:hypothetical protein